MALFTRFEGQKGEIFGRSELASSLDRQIAKGITRAMPRSTENTLQETSRSASRVARNALLVLHVLELVDKNPNVFAVVDWNGDQVQPAKGKCLLQRRY
jgi:hypothetical protein